MQDRRKLVGGMFVLTVGGLLMLLPPLVHLFNHDADVFGVPQIVFYLFGVWLLLIVGTAVLTRRLGKDTSAENGSVES
ncbi:hypothetical protein SAMN05216456_1363 [Devosia crocina]|uniref:Uncharacterized protein n=1 Tax=Devosia crocina TaxID=429728 RepID=A0A1I7NA29_9HYPH|nr:hypothetical protein [Devosia crocina]SFV31508.1 hypothetical protein SAMN05216456_1363 [Devosia crocina]